MLSPYEPYGPYITQGAAAYPAEMNKLAADEFVRAAVMDRTERIQAHSMVKTAAWANTLVAKSKVLHRKSQTLQNVDTQHKPMQNIVHSQDVRTVVNGTGFPKVTH